MPPGTCFRSRQFKDRKKGWLDDRKTLRRYVEAEYVEAELFTTPIHDQYKVVCILTHLLHFYFLFYHLFRLFSRDSIRGYVRLSVGLSVSPSVTLSSNRNWRIRSWQNGLLGATGCTHGVLVIPTLQKTSLWRFYHFLQKRYGLTDRWTNGPTDRRTDGRTNTASYRDARTHLKTSFNMTGFNSIFN